MSLATTATFIGHNECYELSAEKVEFAIIELAEKGVNEFLNGGQGGFDRLCADCVNKIKSKYPYIKKHLSHTLFEF